MRRRQVGECFQGPGVAPQLRPWWELPRAQQSTEAPGWASPAWHLLVGVLDGYCVGPIRGWSVVDSVGAIPIITHLHRLSHTWAKGIVSKASEHSFRLLPPGPRHSIPVGPSTATCRGARPAWLQSTVKVWGTRALTPAPSPGPEHFTFPGSTTSFTGTRNGLPARKTHVSPSPPAPEGLPDSEDAGKRGLPCL